MKRAAIERAVSEITGSNFLLPFDKNSGFREFIDCLETIQAAIKERPSLRSFVDFDAILEISVKDFGLWINGGNGKVLFHDPFKKEHLFLKEIGIFREPIPMIKIEFRKVIDELLSGSPPQEFRFMKSKAKFIPWKAFVAESGYSEKWIKTKIEDGTIPDEMIEYGRQRGQGREIVSISSKALKKLKK